MQSVKVTPEKETSSPPAPPLAGEGDVLHDAVCLDELTRYRRNYLDALPLAAAVLGMGEGGPVIEDANASFGRLCAVPGPLAGRSVAAVPLLAGELRAQVASFCGGNESSRQFAWKESQDIGARHFTVRIGSLLPTPQHGQRCLLTLLDRTSEIETARSLRAEMVHDSLTGLPNRVAFSEALDEAIASKRRFAVMMVDLRRFSRINESLGGMVGDELIITVARRLISSLRAGDVLARLGGDEFAVLFHLVEGEKDALVGAGRLQNAFQSPVRLSDLEIQVECAIGCAFGCDSDDSEELVRNAQFAMKQAKASRRVEVYHPGEASLARRRFSLETELRRAIEGGDLKLAFQPLIDFSTGRVSSFEALARWDHPTLGTITPSEFVPVAEESGLIKPLGRWALDAAAQTVKDWDRRAGAPLDISVGVNVSAMQIVQDDVPALVADTLDRHALSGQRLTLELTESVIIHDPQRATGVLKALKGLAVRIALDDFGTGYSSLAYLQRLPIDVLKIDRSFVTGMLRDRDSVAIVRAVLGLADALGMDTTAEGVETVELAQTLGALGCGYGQGFHFAVPLAPDAAYSFLVARNA